MLAPSPLVTCGGMLSAWIVSILHRMLAPSPLFDLDLPLHPFRSFNPTQDACSLATSTAMAERAPSTVSILHRMLAPSPQSYHVEPRYLLLVSILHRMLAPSPPMRMDIFPLILKSFNPTQDACSLATSLYEDLDENLDVSILHRMLAPSPRYCGGSSLLAFGQFQSYTGCLLPRHYYNDHLDTIS